MTEQTHSAQPAVAAWGDTLMNTYGTPPVELARGEGARVFGPQGTEFIDMLAGIAVNSLGHAHPAVIDAVTEQIGKLGHVSNLFASEPVVQAAQKLKARCGDDAARLFFCNSGGEANEAAFKLARLTGRSRVLAAVNGFHGRTMGSLALTGQPEKRAPFEPLPSGVEFYPYGDIDYLRKLVALNPGDTAAIILEPVQGETGVIPAPEHFLTQVRQLCDESGALMLIDEVQTGVGRTGDFFASWRAGRPRSCSPRARTARPLAATPSPALRRTRCWTLLMTHSSRRCAARGRSSLRRSRRWRACRRCAAAALCSGWCSTGPWPRTWWRRGWSGE